MKKLLVLLGVVFIINNTLGQIKGNPLQTKIMTLGVFHFAFPNLDVVRTSDSKKISVLEEPYQSEIISISKAICNFKPNIIAIEVTPDQQYRIDSLYSLYKNDKFDLEKGEIYQLGFRIGKYLNLPVTNRVGYPAGVDGRERS